MIIMGLGNPGGQYERTRHNTGAMALDYFAKEYKFPGFKASSKYESSISEGEIQGTKVVLAKPETFMNNSGKAANALCRYFKGDLVVLHDEIDLPLGQVRVSQGRGSAGHKGVESIMQELGTKDFTRIRIGIQPADGKPKNTEEFVLKNFSSAEIPLLETSLQTATEALLNLIEEEKKKPSVNLGL
ncbi:MAG: aminoacyl-tRNA hydrolase [bacterium]|nr:aminoacyl-tRNA hydrolase [bacterium]